MKKITNIYFPKISIITCVYNGEKYISKLLDSVLNMGYPNIEHIIINDGSTDSTEDIVLRYARKYQQKPNSNLYVKYIKQENTGLGGATNSGLKVITGKYWTWINCDDWYINNAFFGPITLLEKSSHLDYVLLRPVVVMDKGKTKEYITKKEYKYYRNNRVFYEYCKRDNFKFTLFICRTDSYRQLCPSMSIYPYRYTQDEQFVSQFFGVLKGHFYKKKIWNYYWRPGENYCSKVSKLILNDRKTILIKSMEMTILSAGNKIIRETLLEETILNERLKTSSKSHNFKDSLLLYKKIKLCRKIIPLKIRLYMDHKLFLYLIFSLL